MHTKTRPSLRQAVLAALLSIALTAPAGAQFGPPRPKPTGPWMNKSLSSDQRADLIVAQLTLDEKVSLLHGGGWQMLFAGPAVGVTHSSVFGRYSTALPSCVAEAASWDLDLAREYGTLIGVELRDQGYNMSLGGGVNLAREPRNGRIFEYKGED